jgi:hypothetical protein
MELTRHLSPVIRHSSDMAAKSYRLFGRGAAAAKSIDSVERRRRLKERLRNVFIAGA